MSNKVAVVTGSSSGIGRAIAARLIAGGWQVHGLDIAPPTIESAAFTAHAVDLGEGPAVDSIAAHLLASGTPDALVHAAGVMRVAPLGDLGTVDGERMWRLHVEAAARLANGLLPAMREAGHGRVVLIGSRAAQGLPGRSQYAGTKAALAALAKSWAAEVVAAGVTVNVVSPAATRTGMLADPARAGSQVRLPPIGRLIEPGEVAALVAFLLSADAAAITGQDIAICGGATLFY